MKRIIISAIAVLCFAALATAQTRIFNESISHDKDYVTVSFKVDADKGVPQRYKEVIMPYIYNGSDTLWFGTMEVFGKGRYMRERQERYLAGERRWELGENQMLADGTYTYVSKVPVKKWMKSAAIGIKRYMTGCNCTDDLEDRHLKEGLDLYKEPILVIERGCIPYVLSDVGQSWDFGQEDLTVKFEVGKADLDPYMFENKATFEKILDAVDRIYADGRYKMQHIDISGFASPEGSMKLNYDLADRRAKAIINYIIANRPQYHLSAKDFRVRNGEVNWEGLGQYVMASDMPEKEWVMGILNSDLADQRKINLLRSLDGGNVWKKMNREIFPHLRTARFTGVYYDSSRDDHAVEQINEANKMIRTGRHIDAYNHLLHLKGDMRSYNTVGVSLMQQGMYEEALQWFEMAVQNGCPLAQKNIDAIRQEFEKEEGERRKFELYMKKYE